jgi:Helix-turn-helix domain
MAAVFELEITAMEKLVLLAMADHARDDGTGCYPSVSTLARKTSLTRRGVQKLIRGLEKQLLLSASVRRKGRLNLTTEYQLTLDNTAQSSLWQEGRKPRGPKSGEHNSPGNTVSKPANGSTQSDEPYSPKPNTEPSGTKNKDFSPPGVSISTWREFLDLRSKKHPLSTSGQIDIALRRLAVLASAGNDPQLVVERSIFQGWADFYELPKNSSKGVINADERTSDNFKIAGVGTD